MSSANTPQTMSNLGYSGLNLKIGGIFCYLRDPIPYPEQNEQEASRLLSQHVMCMHSMHVMTIFFFFICGYFCIPCLADIFRFPHFMPITFETVHTSVYIQKTNVHEVFSDSHKYFTFVSHLYLHSYDLLPFPHLTVIFTFTAMNFYCN